MPTATPPARVASLEHEYPTTFPPRPIARPPSPDARADQDTKPIVVVIGGDLGLGGSDQPVSAKGGYRHGKRYRWDDLTKHLAPHINGDLNFANLETVILDSNRVRPIEKRFRFKSHPTGVAHLVDIGFNAFSLANNHAIDFGRQGMRSTVRHIAALRQHGLKLAAGLGKGSGALTPSFADVRAARFALSAVGIGGPSATAERIGMASFRSKRDLDGALRRLRDSAADYKILSVHYNLERSVRAPASAVRLFRDTAVRGRGVDLVVGHHAHVPAGVQAVGGRYIFYGMGNLLHPGMQNMAKFNRCRDYGLLARLHLMPRPEGRLAMAAIEVMALTDMHLRARLMSPKQGRRRIAVLNALAAQYDSDTHRTRGVRFRPQADGSGLFCTDASKGAAGRIGRLCAAWTPPTPATATQRAASRDCQQRWRGDPVVAKANRGRRSSRRRSRSRRASRTRRARSARASRRIARRHRQRGREH